jgi:hypothetical protein
MKELIIALKSGRRDSESLDAVYPDELGRQSI